MEIAIAVFIGLWLTVFSVWAYKRVNKDYSNAPAARAKSGKADGRE